MTADALRLYPGGPDSDSLLDGKFNASDVQNEIRQAEGEQVTLRVRRVRLPFFSAYRNIIEVTR